MAKKEKASKIVLERTYNVPLRKEFQKAAKWRRSKKAVKALREFIAKHMKSEKVLIGKYANQFIWKDGIKNPPHHVKVNAIKDDKGVVRVELVDLPGKAKREEAKQKKLEEKKKDKEAKKEELKTEAKKTEEEKKEEKLEETLGEAKKEKEEKAKEIEKEEIKELKKEHPKLHRVKQPPQPKQIEQHPTAPRSQ